MPRRFLVAVILAMALLIPATADAASLTLKWSSLTSSIKPGTYATAVVKTTAGATCGIVVKYATTVSSAKGLSSKKAPAGGTLSWRWKVGSSTNPGTWRVTVTCRLGSMSLSIWRTMTIT